MKIQLKEISNITKVTILLSIAFLITSLSQNAYFIYEKQESIGSHGLAAFLLGWLFMFDIKVVPWLANPLLFASYFFILINKIKKAKLTGTIALFFGLSFLLYEKMPANEGGYMAEITGYDTGYWLWLSCLTINFFGIQISDYFNSD